MAAFETYECQKKSQDYELKVCCDYGENRFKTPTKLFSVFLTTSPSKVFNVNNSRRQ